AANAALLPDSLPPGLDAATAAALRARLATLPGSSAGLFATLRGLRDQTEVCNGALELPLDWSLSPPHARRLEGRDLRADFASEHLALADIAPLISGVDALSGEADLQASAAGPAADPRLDGKLHLPRLAFALPSGTRIAAHDHAQVSGSVQHPAVGGSVQLDYGTIRIPE